MNIFLTVRTISFVHLSFIFYTQTQKNYENSCSITRDCQGTFGDQGLIALGRAPGGLGAIRQPPNQR